MCIHVCNDFSRKIELKFDLVDSQTDLLNSYFEYSESYILILVKIQQFSESEIIFRLKFHFGNCLNGNFDDFRGLLHGNS